MSLGWFVLALIVIILVWAGWKLRNRDWSSGPEARGDHERRTGKYPGPGGGA